MARAGKERRQGRLGALTSCVVVATLVLASCSGRHATRPRDAGPSEAERDAAAQRAEAARIERDFPLHGLVRARQIRIQAGADRATETLGYLRRGTRLRIAREVQRGPGCTEGWYAIDPRGLVCKGTDVLVGETPPDPAFAAIATAQNQPLPYDYFFVTSYTAQYFRPPEGAEWRASIEYVGRYRHFAEEEPEKLQAFREGKLRSEPTKPEVVFDVSPRGYLLASPHQDSREGQDWVRTVQGRWVAAGHLQRRLGSSFHGFVLDDGSVTLPIAIVNRPTTAQRTVDRGREGIRFVDDETQTFTRYQILGPTWQGRTRIGDFRVHRVGPERYLKEWYVSVIDRITPEFEVGADEFWIHVDVSEQTLVAYRGRTPIYGTLVSTGVPGHETPRGRFRIEQKFVGNTMDNLGPEAGADDYRIEDVPWTQYFRDGLALHAAFWHDRFGIARSHGCVNLTPTDAHWLFDRTSPVVPPGWHGIPTRASGQRGTLVYVGP